jgi:hypothetical protein
MEFSRQLQIKITIISGAVLCVILLGAMLKNGTLALPNISKLSALKTSEASQNTSTDHGDISPSTQDKPPTSAPVVQEQAPTSNKPDASEYAYTVQYGDSYTTLARKAIQEYIQTHSIDANTFDNLNAEVTIVNNAGAPEVAVGQTVTIKAVDVSRVIDASKR